MNHNVKKILDVVEEIKEGITDYQYKTVMDNLMILNNNKNEDEEGYDEILRTISFLNIYIPSIKDNDVKISFIKRLDFLNSLLLERY